VGEYVFLVTSFLEEERSVMRRGGRCPRNAAFLVPSPVFEFWQGHFSP